MVSKIGIIGLGSVGKANEHALGFYHTVLGYDIRGEYDWKSILETDMVLVCVDTPIGEDGRLNCSHVTEVLHKLHADAYQNPVVIRSTVRVGYMDNATKMFPDLHLVYMPEFLRERSRLQWAVCPDRLVFAGAKEDIIKVLEAFDWVEDAVIIEMDFKSAEVGKLAHNAFIATKVSFTNEIEDLCTKLGADPHDVMEVVTADRRIKSKEHLRPHFGPYEGKCVPKDTIELMNATEDAPLLRTVHEVNERVKKEEMNDIKEPVPSFVQKATRSPPGGME